MKTVRQPRQPRQARVVQAPRPAREPKPIFTIDNELFSEARGNTLLALRKLKGIIQEAKEYRDVISACKEHREHCKLLHVFVLPPRPAVAKDPDLGKKAASDIAAQTAGENTEWADVLKH